MKSFSPTLRIFVFLFFYCCVALAQTHKENVIYLKAFEKAVDETVLLNHHAKLLPIIGLADRTIASVSFDFEYHTVFDSLLNKYAKVTPFNQLEKYANLNDLEDDLAYFNTIIVSLSDNTLTKPKLIDFINHLARNKQVVIAFYGSAKNLSMFDKVSVPIIWNAHRNMMTASIIPQIIFGGIAARGTLSSNFSAKYTAGMGFTTKVIRLKFTVPEDANINTDHLNQIDALAAQAIHEKATPGLVVLGIKNGKVFFNKAYGFHTYEQKQADKVTDIFDLASVTKTTATTPAVMRLVQQKKLNLDTNIGFYLSTVRNKAMSEIHLREVMLHQAGFVPFIPFYKTIADSDHSKQSSPDFPTIVADGYYVRKNYFKNVMWSQMLDAPITTRGKYVYSDISMYVMKEIVEHITEMPLNQYVETNFYKPLGMQTAGYLPRERFDKNRIVPTQNDTSFRKTLLQGYVHDEGAALAGGLAGHAGLFATANDLAIYYQMLLNKGTYGGENFFDPDIVTMFTSRQSDVSRRGLGFDRWDPDRTKKYPSEFSSSQTYGHTGYTGIGVWVDPSRDLVFVFLSNRVNPQVNSKLLDLNTRGKILDVFDKAIDAGN